MNAEEPHYPTMITRTGGRDRPLAVTANGPGEWQVTWRSGRRSIYNRDPRSDLALGYEPRASRLCACPRDPRSAV